ncbi:MAG: glucosidase, partial [Cyanobacteria bacterium P01_A01_bin.17]
MTTPEEQRLIENRDRISYWKRWGPYLSERQWGTVREDYSAYGEAWDYFSHDQARSRAYRWGEDGLLGISDNHQRLCFALALWNGEDPILKERLYGLTGSQGNHGEDVKEYYFYLDSTPTHSYMKGLYKYPQAAFPYQWLEEENRQRGRDGMEFELLDTGVFNEDRYFDVMVEYAKASAEDILMRISVTNRGPETKTLHLLPTLWFRNTWAWDKTTSEPFLKAKDPQTVQVSHPDLGERWWTCSKAADLLFTNNETNFEHLFQTGNASPYVKDGIHNYIVQGQQEAVNPDRVGTKAAAYYPLTIGAGETQVVELRLSDRENSEGSDFDAVFCDRISEADAFYATVTPSCTKDLCNIQRQAFAGMLWTKQTYHFIVEDWLQGDPNNPEPPEGHQKGRNSQWKHLHSDDIISMPDKWEYPWFAAWDLAFHAIPLALVDAEFAKKQLDLMTREWYMHPNGQLPAYEW